MRQKLGLRSLTCNSVLNLHEPRIISQLSLKTKENDTCLTLPKLWKTSTEFATMSTPNEIFQNMLTMYDLHNEEWECQLIGEFQKANRSPTSTPKIIQQIKDGTLPEVYKEAIYIATKVPGIPGITDGTYFPRPEIEARRREIAQLPFIAENLSSTQ